MTLRVLVTGAGSVVGQGIIKALRLSGLPLSIVAADIDPLNAALYRTDEAVLLPRVEDDDAFDGVAATLRSQRIEAVLIGSEYDVAFFAERKADLEAETDAKIVVSPPEVVELADDKFETYLFLRDSGLPHPASCAPADADEAAEEARTIGYPVVLKARKGTSSRQVYVVASEAELRALFPMVSGPMVQALIVPPERGLAREFTCCMFKAADGSVLGPFTARRSLRGGSSWVVEVRAFPNLHPLLAEIGKRLPINGPFNVQLAVGYDGPMPFEFNARFSGTTAIRAHFGFNDAAMAVESFVHGRLIEQPQIRQGLALRYEEEVFLDGILSDDLERPFARGEVHRWF